MTNILRTFSLSSGGGISAIPRAGSTSGPSSPLYSGPHPSVSLPKLQSPKNAINTQASTQRIYYNVIQDYFPIDNENQWRPADTLSPLNVNKGDIVQFICTHKNNTVVVKLLNKLGQGLVPLRCLSLNAELTTLSSPSIFSPKTPKALKFEAVSEEPGALKQQDSRCSSVSSVTDTNYFLVRSCKVVSTSTLNERTWYRVETTTLSDHKRYLCRYYQDFYRLQCQLLDEIHKLSLDSKLLPTLPPPMANKKSKRSESLSDRLNSFTEYLESLLNSEAIPLATKQAILYDQWLCPKSGDLVQTPRGSLYRCIRSSNTDKEELQWSKIQATDLTNTQEHIAKVLCPDANSHNRSLSICTKSSLASPSSPKLSQPQFHTGNSQPSSPILSQRSQCLFNANANANAGAGLGLGLGLGFGPNKDTIKLKITFGNDCYVVKCQICDIETWEKLENLIHTRLIKDIPDTLCPLTIRMKSSSSYDGLLPLDSTNFDIDNIIYMAQEQQSPNANSNAGFNPHYVLGKPHAQYNITAPSSSRSSSVSSSGNVSNSPKSKRQSLKLTLEVSV